MAKFKGKYRVESARNQAWDYCSAGSYFVTIVTKDRACFFGEIKDDILIHNEVGKLALEEWVQTIEKRKKMKVELGEFVIMPNHLHGIVTIGKNIFNSNIYRSAYEIISSKEFRSPSNNLSAIIRGFKSAVTTKAKKLNSKFAWHPRFHDRIIRDQEEYDRITNYIRDNPKRWKGK